jgi:hypothetical protein
MFSIGEVEDPREGKARPSWERCVVRLALRTTREFAILGETSLMDVKLAPLDLQHWIIILHYTPCACHAARGKQEASASERAETRTLKLGLDSASDLRMYFVFCFTVDQTK